MNIEIALWAIVVELAVAICLLGYFSLQVGILNARIMHSVTRQNELPWKTVAHMADHIVTVRTGQAPAPMAGREEEVRSMGWVPDERPVGSA